MALCQHWELAKGLAGVTPAQTWALPPGTLTTALSRLFINHFSFGDISENILEIHLISQENKINEALGSKKLISQGNVLALLPQPSYVHFHKKHCLQFQCHLRKMFVFH